MTSISREEYNKLRRIKRQAEVTIVLSIICIVVILIYLVLQVPYAAAGWGVGGFMAIAGRLAVTLYYRKDVNPNG